MTDLSTMDSTQHGARAGNFVIIGSTAGGPSRMTQDAITDLLARLQHAVSQSRSTPQMVMPQMVMPRITAAAAEDNDVVVEVQEFVPEEEITVVESGEIVRSRPPGMCFDILMHWQ